MQGCAKAHMDCKGSPIFLQINFAEIGKWQQLVEMFTMHSSISEMQ